MSLLESLTVALLNVAGISVSSFSCFFFVGLLYFYLETLAFSGLLVRLGRLKWGLSLWFVVETCVMLAISVGTEQGCIFGL